MKVVVIGAAGFVGARLARLLSANAAVSALELIDHAPMEALPKARLRQGGFDDPKLMAPALDGAGAVVCLASVLGGAAEADPGLARRVNLDATMDLIDLCKQRLPGGRFVFASSVAALRAPLPEPVTDAAPLGAHLLYGAHKQMIEVLLSHAARRGWLDAVSLRPSGVMARDGADAALKSAFMSRVFYAVARGEEIILPVAEDSRTWLASVQNVARNFEHAVLVPDLGPDLGPDRALTLPALSLTFGALVDALQRRFPGSGARVRFAPDPETIALFGAMPALETALADRLGFTRDTDADALVRHAF